MSNLPNDPLLNISINTFAKKLRSGDITSEQVVKSYLHRIEALNDKLHAFIFIDEKKAIDNAIAIDKLINSGVDLGPLMGLPVAIKDICSVNGMPTTNGSIVESDDLTGKEGKLVKRLKELGCVIIGKTHTVEFALGATGLNKHRGTPWNPWDLKTHRIPGGSSSGSAVAVASGLVPFAIGTDTGGSVRIPASLTGIAGLKTTKDVWPTDGIFPLSPTLDTPGPLARSFEDIKTIFETYGSGLTKNLDPISIGTLKLGKLGKPFTDDLDAEVHFAFEKICEQLTEKGAKLIEVDVPEASERVNLFPPIVGSEIVYAFGEKRFLNNCDNMDPVTAKRAKVGLDVKSIDYLKLKNRLKELEIMASNFFKDYDALISPTTVMRAMKVKDCETDGDFHDRSLLSSANTQPGNLFNLCGISYPIQRFCNDYKSDTCLPVGLQVLCANGNDSKAIEIGIALEKEFGYMEFPNLDEY